MASGTGNLPNQNMDFTPFDILTAEEMDDLVENIESLADGSGIGDGAIGTDTLAQSAVTPDKLDTGAAYAYSNDAGTRANSSFGALTGGGTNPSVTVDVPNTGMVFLSFGADAYSSTTNELCEISVSTSGANSGVAIPAVAIRVGTNSGNPYTTGFTSQLLTGLTPGSTTFALVYRAFGTGNFRNRKLLVIPLG